MDTRRERSAVDHLCSVCKIKVKRTVYVIQSESIIRYTHINRPESRHDPIPIPICGYLTEGK